MIIHLIFWIPDLHSHIALFDPSPPVLNEEKSHWTKKILPYLLQGTLTLHKAEQHRSIPGSCSAQWEQHCCTMTFLQLSWASLPVPQYSPGAGTCSFSPRSNFPREYSRNKLSWYSSQHLLLGVSEAFLNISWKVVFVCCLYLLFPTILKLFLGNS